MNNAKLKTIAGQQARKLLDNDKHETQPAQITTLDKAGKLQPLRTGPDIYRVMQQAAGKIPDNAEALLALTVGWAAPADNDHTEDFPPSFHPNRIRVALVLAVNLHTGEQISALAFANKKKTLYQNGNGTLQDALTELLDSRHK